MNNNFSSLMDRYDRGAISRRQLLAALTAGAALPTFGQDAEPKTPAFEAKS